MFKWPALPSPRAHIHELADFAELTCWKDSATSATALSRSLARLEENDYSDGVPEEDEIDRRVEEAYAEIERRQEASGDGYPFMIGDPGLTLQASQDTDNPRHVIYKYLLLATRLNMKDDRVHAGIDGALLLEELSAEAAREYFGDRAKSIVFGTAADNNRFPDKVNDLCYQLGEGGGFSNNYELRFTRVRDGKLDVVVWNPFTDGLPGKLIGFGQCKTGTYYENELTQLQPDVFRDMWMRSPLVVLPVRMFFLAEALASAGGGSIYTSRRAGLLFDRCRIIDFCNEVNKDVIAKVRKWTEAAAKAVELPELV